MVVVEEGVVLQVNDAADRIRLVIFVSKVQLFYVQITVHTGWGRGERRGVPMEEIWSNRTYVALALSSL
jgi:hypothetical protein